MSQSDQLLQLDIDFLPARYREECAQRKTHLLRLVSAGLFAIVLLACTAWQWQAGRRLAAELAVIAPIHESAHERTVQLTTLNNELTSAVCRAELLTYLRHPWPKTQLVAAIVEPMPTSVKLSELAIGNQVEEVGSSLLPSQRERNRTDGAGESTTSKEKLSASQEDLRQLRAEFDSRTLVINMAGETTHVSELHEYLSSIARHPLIVKAELRSIESDGRESKTTLFRARIVVRSGYGQPGGPTRTTPVTTPGEAATEAIHQARHPLRLERTGS